MAVYHPTTVTCPCGNSITANLARSINAGRTPAIRETIIHGEFHRVNCPQCGRRQAVESPFFYTDLSRHAIYHVRPRSERYNFRRDSKRLDDAADAVPADFASSAPRQLRIIYGLDELREKLVAQDAGLDDRVVELLKIFALQEHPFLLQQPRLLMHLAAVNAASVDMAAYHQHGTEQFKVSLPRPVADDIVARERELRAWSGKAHKRDNMFALKDHWVSFRRWSTRYDSLDALRALAKEVEERKNPKLNTADFKKMVARLPRANQLPPWAKRDLRTVYDYAKANGYADAEDKLFEVRFGFELENEWSQNKNADDIDTIWQLLRSLPASNVEGNTKIAKLTLDSGGGGVYGNDTIGIGEKELGKREGFEDTLRHEVGHAVHEQRDAIVTPWLEKQFGWHLFTNDPGGIDQWVKLMGGWGTLSAQQRSDVVQYLRQVVGPGGKWTTGPRPNPPSNHPWWGKNFGPRLACENSGKEDWFTHFKDWYRVGTKAFALNYWYAQFMVVDTATLDLVDKMPDNYAAMSHFEFFAETYALYYDYDDPKRKVIPAAVAKWLDANIGKREAENPRRPAARKKPQGKRQR
ncbi:MAG TPA: CpXC domain-containing protein [Candidatus Binatus sp.]|nr:CpXC domain-containing protein [Candidatus Binatus sp.]